VKVLLVNPPELHTVQANLPAAVEQLRGATSPINLLYPAAVARESGRDVELLDAHAERLGYQALAARIASSEPDVIGITATTFTLLDAIETARIAKKAAPSATVICGGLQPFLYPEETARLDAFDVCLRGEAESTFVPLLNAIENKEPFDQVPGSIFLRDGKVILGPDPEPISELDSIPTAAHDLLDLRLYSSLVTDRSPVGVMISSRGCPYRCAFCSHSVTGKRYRVRSAESVVEEMAWCESLGMKYILFYDEVMSIQRERMLELCEQISQRGLGLRWMARARAGALDTEMLAAMKRAGCDLVTMGIESGSPKVLKRLNRPQNVDEAVESFTFVRKAGLRSIAYFMIGCPDETETDLRMSLDVAKRAAPDMVHASIFVPYPATDLYEEGLREGRFASDYWREFSANPTADFQTRLWIDPAEADRRLAWFYRGYHLRLGYIWQRLKALRSWKELSQNVRGAIAVFTMGRKN
jgi:radical SAM superfamily enzyme YgiQ (UPF0313 family)